MQGKRSDHGKTREQVEEKAQDSAAIIFDSSTDRFESGHCTARYTSEEGIKKLQEEAL